MLDTGDMRGTIDLAADEETLVDPFNRQTRVWLSIGSGNGHVHHAVAQRDHGRWDGGC